jgi:uroporphyrinogen III methyltransferase/synthase
VSEAVGRVYLIGAGPGDPELLTLRGQRLLQRAQVLVYDRLVSPALLGLAPDDCQRIFAGKCPGVASKSKSKSGSKSKSIQPAVSQDEINALLIEHARAGKMVCRLKGGDPFVFGRGGEEAEALAEAGVPFEVVPGVTSAVAVPAYAGIPVTYRGLASVFGVITGHEQAGESVTEPGWDARGLDTIIFLMGVERLADLVAGLLRQGRSPETPAAVIRCGTLPAQETVSGTLNGIVTAARERDLQPPAVLVVGEVVRLRERLRWFDVRPLFGRRIVVTRPRAQVGELSVLLRDLGAEVIELPVLRIRAILDPDLSFTGRRYDWILFTSANAARCLGEALAAAGKDLRAVPHARVAAIGAATAEAVRAVGLRVDLVPPAADAEGLLEAMRGPLEGRRILMLRARAGRDVLPEGLRARGAEVEIVPLYDTVTDHEAVGEKGGLLQQEGIDAVTFSSPSAVRAFRELLPNLPIEGLPAVCIGAPTEAAARETGFERTHRAVETSAAALAAAVVNAVTEGKV